MFHNAKIFYAPLLLGLLPILPNKFIQPDFHFFESSSKGRSGREWTVMTIKSLESNWADILVSGENGKKVVVFLFGKPITYCKSLLILDFLVR